MDNIQCCNEKVGHSVQSWKQLALGVRVQMWRMNLKTLSKGWNAPRSHFRRVWRDKFAKEIQKVRKATQFLTRHVKSRPAATTKVQTLQIPKECRSCHANDKTKTLDSAHGGQLGKVLF